MPAFALQKQGRVRVWIGVEKLLVFEGQPCQRTAATPINLLMFGV